MIEKTSFTYKLVYSRRKSIGIIINRDKSVTVRVPYYSSKKAVERFVVSKSGWVLKHLNKQTEKLQINCVDNLHEGSSTMYLGNTYTIAIKESKSFYVRLTGQTMEIGSKTVEGQKIALQLKRWYQQQASTVFAPKMEELIKIHSKWNFRPTEMAIRSLKSRWGSCSRSGKITLNSELVKIDPKYAEYVILHELCHLKEMNHGKGFYSILEEVCPGYKTIRKDMRQYRLG